ncbi:hypothetical protein HYS92_01640 [Candidatus Daviesbacteria bacterium]|nr:hypothetical protein [Candidatus Daviesbacteria bacterium]
MTFAKEALIDYFAKPERLTNAVFLVSAISSMGVALLMIVSSLAAQEAASKKYLQEWSSRLNSQLAGRFPLGEAEARYNELIVTSAAPTWVEKLEADRQREPVNVRNYAGTYLPNGVGTSVIGEITPGSKITGAVWTWGPMPYSPAKGRWAAFRCKNAQGVAWRPEVVGNLDERVCAIFGDYLRVPTPADKAPKR